MQKTKCKWLGIDYGERRIGLSITDELLIMARPYRVIDSQIEEPLSTISEIVKRENVCLIVIGNPIHLSGKESELSIKVREFMEKLRRMIPDKVKMVLYDERFTSKMAERMLANRGVDLRKSKKEIDLYAATYLLQEYLDYHK